MDGNARKREAQMAVMPLGKHKGKDVREVPFLYLKWLSTQPWLYESVRSAVVEELRRREDEDRRRRAEELQRRRGQLPNPRVVEDLIEVGRRQLARRVHPDVEGGSH